MPRAPKPPRPPAVSRAPDSVSLSFMVRKAPPVSLAGVLDDPLDAELIGEFAAEIHEAHPHVVALDERLDQRPVAIALPDAPRPIVRLRADRGTGCRRKSRSSRPSVLGLTNSGPEALRPVAERGDFSVSLHQPRRRDGKAGGGSEREARELVLAKMRRGGGTAEAREALEAGQGGNRRAAIEAHAVGERPHDRPVARRRQCRSTAPAARRAATNSASIPSRASACAMSSDEQRQVGRLGEIDGDLGGDVGRIAERRRAGGAPPLRSRTRSRRGRARHRRLAPRRGASRIRRSCRPPGP